MHYVQAIFGCEKRSQEVLNKNEDCLQVVSKSVVPSRGLDR